MSQIETQHMRMTYGFVLNALRNPDIAPDLVKQMGDGTMTVAEAIAEVERHPLDKCVPVKGCTGPCCNGEE